MMLMCFLCFFFFFPFFFILSWNNIDNMSILEALCWIWQSHIWNKLLLRSLIFLSFRKTTWRVLPVRNILLLSLFVFLGLFLNLYWGIMDRKKLYIVHMFWWIWAYSYIKHNTRSFPSGSVVKNLPATQELQDMWVQTLGQEDPLEKGMATRSSIPAWRISWAEEPGRLQGCKESDRLKQMSMHITLYTITTIKVLNMSIIVLFLCHSNQDYLQ